jgi:hypothetical protein
MSKEQCSRSTRRRRPQRTGQPGCALKGHDRGPQDTPTNNCVIPSGARLGPHDRNAIMGSEAEGRWGGAEGSASVFRLHDAAISNA